MLCAHTSGYNHGCSDAQISNPSDKYINQPEQGPTFHTPAFMQAYHEGFNACSFSNKGSNANSINNNNDNRPRSQSSDWILTVNAVNVPFGNSNIHISIKGPFGYSDFDNIPNSQYPSIASICQEINFQPDIDIKYV